MTALNRLHLLASAAVLAVSLAFAPAADAQVVARKDRFGDAMEVLLPAAAAALTLKRDDRDGITDLGLSTLLALGTTEGLKRTVRSNRPDGTPNGFPSAHTAIAFASSAYVHQRYGFQWAAPMYALATATAYTRVSTHNHHIKDVVAGALVGIGSAYLMTFPYSARTRAVVMLGDHAIRVDVASQW